MDDECILMMIGYVQGWHVLYKNSPHREEVACLGPLGEQIFYIFQEYYLMKIDIVVWGLVSKIQRVEAWDPCNGFMYTNIQVSICEHNHIYGRNCYQSICRLIGFRAYYPLLGFPVLKSVFF